MAKQKKPFSVKGIKVTSPKGKALWCKVTEADYEYNDKGVYQTDMIVDPNDPTVKAYIDKLEALRDEAAEQTRETLGAKAKNLEVLDVFTPEEDSDGNETGMIKLRFKMPNVDDRDKGKDKVTVLDAKTRKIPHDEVPLVGNDSIIRCRAYAYPYFMAGDAKRKLPPCLGVTNVWEAMQIIDLQEYEGDAGGFEEEDGFEAEGFEESEGFEEEGKGDEDGDF